VCSAMSLPITMMPSKYAIVNGCSSVPMILSKARLNVAAAGCNPNGMTRHWKRPRPGTVNAVYCLLSEAMGICQYQLIRSTRLGPREESGTHLVLTSH